MSNHQSIAPDQSVASDKASKVLHPPLSQPAVFAGAEPLHIVCSLFLLHLIYIINFKLVHGTVFPPLGAGVVAQCSVFLLTDSDISATAPIQTGVKALSVSFQKQCLSYSG